MKIPKNTGQNPPITGQKAAEALGAQALEWLAGDAEMLTGFLSASGLSPRELMTQASDPALLGAILDHLMTSDDMVMSFCDALGLDYRAPQMARAALPGGETWHWT